MRTSKRTRWQRLSATVLLAAASALGGVAAAQPASAAGCTLRYQTNLWPVDANGNPTLVPDGEGGWVPTGEVATGTGFTVAFDLTNNGAAINPWKATWATRGRLQLVGNQVWNATVTRKLAGSALSLVYLQGLDWNAALPSGGTVSFGAQGILPGTTLTAEQVVPAFSLAGTGCTIVR